MIVAGLRSVVGIVELVGIVRLVLVAAGPGAIFVVVARQVPAVARSGAVALVPAVVVALAPLGVVLVAPAAAARAGAVVVAAILVLVAARPERSSSSRPSSSPRGPGVAAAAGALLAAARSRARAAPRPPRRGSAAARSCALLRAFGFAGAASALRCSSAAGRSPAPSITTGALTALPATAATAPALASVAPPPAPATSSATRATRSPRDAVARRQPAGERQRRQRRRRGPQPAARAVHELAHGAVREPEVLGHLVLRPPLDGDLQQRLALALGQRRQPGERLAHDRGALGQLGRAAVALERVAQLLVVVARRRAAR